MPLPDGARPSWVRISEVSEMTAVSVRTLKRYVAAGSFPPPIKLTSRTSVWFEHEVVDWMNDQAQAHRRAA